MGLTDDLKVRIGADITEAQKGFKKLASAGALLKASFITLAVGGVAKFVGASINAAEEMLRLSKVTGLSVEQLSTLKYATEQADLNFESFTSGMKLLSRSMGEATNLGSDVKKSFDSIGVSVKNTDGSMRPLRSVLSDLADKFKVMPNGAEKTALALKLFGRAGQEMIPFLNEGSAGIAKLQARAKELGLEISTNTAKQADEFNDRIKELKGFATGAGNALAKVLLPELNKFTSLIKTLDQGKMEKVLSFFKWTALHLTPAGLALNSFLNSAKPLPATIKDIGDAAADTAPKVDAFTKAIDAYFADAGKRAEAFRLSMKSTFESFATDMSVALLTSSGNWKRMWVDFLKNVLHMTIQFAIQQLGIFEILSQAIALALTDPLLGAFVIGGLIVGLSIAVGELESRYKSEAVPGFASGIDYVPQNMNANIHQGERIVPAETNKDLTEFMRKGGGVTVVQKPTYSFGRPGEAKRSAKILGDMLVKMGYIPSPA